VAINTTASEQPFVVTLSNVAADALLPYVTSDSQDMTQAASISVTSGELALTLAPRSVTTLVGDIKRVADAPRPRKIYLPYF
jgi:O-glycosyl hydrolase